MLMFIFVNNLQLITCNCQAVFVLIANTTKYQGGTDFFGMLSESTLQKIFFIEIWPL